MEQFIARTALLLTAVGLAIAMTVRTRRFLKPEAFERGVVGGVLTVLSQLVALTIIKPDGYLPDAGVVAMITSTALVTGFCPEKLVPNRYLRCPKTSDRHLRYQIAMMACAISIYFLLEGWLS